jgi:cytosolic carboxypeptidase protein 2/3
VPYYEREEEVRQFVGMNPKLNLTDELVFDSNFESGNLDMVIKRSENEYNLYMRVDTNTRGHHQWFYFTVTVPGSWNRRTVQFTVCNFTKHVSLYNQGMRIAVAKKSNGFQWHKAGDEIEYRRSNLIRRDHIDPAYV